jgi:polyisoprenyl-phosphate glycosyltransferase
VPGWASLVVSVLFLGGVQLMSLGVIGEYVGRIYTEVKGRPLYIAAEKFGFSEAETLPLPRGSSGSPMAGRTNRFAS